MSLEGHMRDWQEYLIEQCARMEFTVTYDKPYRDAERITYDSFIKTTPHIKGELVELDKLQSYRIKLWLKKTRHFVKLYRENKLKDQMESLANSMPDMIELTNIKVEI